MSFCTTWIHWLVQHPKIVIIGGLLLTVQYLGNSPNGPGNQQGLKTTVSKVEASIVIDESTQARIDEMMTTTTTLTDEQIKYVLDVCQCEGLNAENVRSDPALLVAVTKLYVYDHFKHSIDIETAQREIIID